MNQREADEGDALQFDCAGELKMLHSNFACSFSVDIILLLRRNHSIKKIKLAVIVVLLHL